MLRKLAIGILAFVIAAAALYASLHFLAEIQSNRSQHEWATIFASPEAVETRFPPQESNEVARQIEKLAAEVGVDVVPRGCKDRPRLTDEDKKDYELFHSELVSWVASLSESESSPPPPLPALVVAHLELSKLQIDDLHLLLTQGKLPQWSRDVLRLDPSPIPNLFGILKLQRVLLADAVLSSSRGDGKRVNLDLESSWTLIRCLEARSTTISHLVRVAMARIHTATLRTIPTSDSSWIVRLDPTSFKEGLLLAMRVEAWVVAHPDYNDRVHMNRRSNPWWERPVYVASRPYWRLVSLHSSASSRNQVQEIESTRQWCRSSLPELKWSSWNLAKFHDAPLDLRFLAYRLKRLELEFELTAWVIRLRSEGVEFARRFDTASVACPGDEWLVTENGNEVSVTYSGNVDSQLPVRGGVTPPLSFSVEPRVGVQ